MQVVGHSEAAGERPRQHAEFRPPSSVTARRLTIWLEAGLDTAALLFFPLLVLAPRGIAALASAAGLFAGILVLARNGPELRPALVVPAALLGSLLVWGAISAVWSVDPLRTVEVAARLTGLFAAGLALAAAANRVAAPRRLTLFLLGGFALGIAMAATDLATDGALSAPFFDHVFRVTRLNRASVSFAILLLPVSAVSACRGQPLLALLFATAAAAIVCALAGTAAKAVLTAGLGVGLLLYLARARVARAAAVLSVLVIITAPLSFAMIERLPSLTERADAVKVSAGHRLLIWSFVGDRIAERPLAGWGLDSSRAFPGGKDPIRPGESWLPLHPHNAPLQLWLELGVPGAVVFALLVAAAWLGLAEAEWPRLFAAAAGGSLAIGLVASFATYGIWQEWWLGTLLFSLFLVLVMARVASGRNSGRVAGFPG